VNAVNHLLKQFGEMRKMMKQMGSGNVPNMPGGMGRMAGLAARAGAARNEELPPGFEALGAGMAAGSQTNRSGGSKNKKKKGGRVTPPKQR
jgi:hypothetical protein